MDDYLLKNWPNFSGIGHCKFRNADNSIEAEGLPSVCLVERRGTGGPCELDIWKIDTEIKNKIINNVLETFNIHDEMSCTRKFTRVNIFPCTKNFKVYSKFQKIMHLI